jgi:hypothetical protein
MKIMIADEIGVTPLEFMVAQKHRVPQEPIDVSCSGQNLARTTRSPFPLVRQETLEALSFPLLCPEAMERGEEEHEH